MIDPRKKDPAYWDEDEKLKKKAWDDIFGKKVEDELLDEMVHHPPHYMRNGAECIEWIEEMLTPEEFKGYLKGCACKYIWRHEDKGKREQDLQKAQWYLKYLEEY